MELVVEKDKALWYRGPELAKDNGKSTFVKAWDLKYDWDPVRKKVKKRNARRN